jgi:hypothetical protein
VSNINPSGVEVRFLGFLSVVLIELVILVFGSWTKIESSNACLLPLKYIFPSCATILSI